MRFMMFPPVQSLSLTQGYVLESIMSWDAGTMAVFFVDHRASGAFVGQCTLSFGPNGCELGYILAARFAGQGLATQAARAVSDWALGLPGVHRIQATCHRDHGASARVLIKAGFQAEGTLRAFMHYPRIGPKPCDTMMFSRVSPPIAPAE